jgi:hypothetical protein
MSLTLLGGLWRLELLPVWYKRVRHVATPAKAAKHARVEGDRLTMPWSWLCTACQLSAEELTEAHVVVRRTRTAGHGIVVSMAREPFSTRTVEVTVACFAQG